MTLEDRLVQETMRIVGRAQRMHKSRKLEHSIYLSRNTKAKDIDITKSPQKEINDYIERNKNKGKFYLIGVHGINTVRLTTPPVLDLVYTMLFHRLLSAVGNLEKSKDCAAINK